MNDLLLHIATIDHQYSIWITWIGFPLFMVCAVFFSSPLLVQKWKEWRMLRRITSTGQETLRDVFLSDGVDGVHYFPFIILTRQAIVFFKKMQIKGVIFAADSIEYWTQVIGKRSYKFHNPLPGLEAETASIKALDKKVAVEGRVIFTSDSCFPKGKPNTVMLESEVKEYLQEKMQGEPNKNLLLSWDLLKSAAEEGKSNKQDSLLMSKPKALSGFRSRMTWLFFLAGIAWLLLRLI